MKGKVAEKAKQLPENGIPPEIMSLLPNDSAYEKMRAQKSAMPVEGMKTLKAATASFRDDRPMAVVLERSSVEEGDMKLRREAVLCELVTNLDATGGVKKQNQ